MNSLNGPFHFVEKSIDNYVLNALPGTYLLGEMQGGRFSVKFVGRADECLNFRLKEKLGQYSYFKFGYAQTAKEAFLKECKFYHDNLKRGLDNTQHPQSPVPDIHCPFCGVK